MIFISALHETLDKVKGFGVGAADYVTKPFQFEEVQARVDRFVPRDENHRREKHISTKSAFDVHTLDPKWRQCKQTF